MTLTDQQKGFLQKRQRLMKAWPYVGPLLTLAILALLAYLFVQVPLIINPYEVIAGLQAGTIEQSTIDLMCLLLPIMSLLMFFLLIVLVVVMYLWIRLERKYLAIIQQEN